METIHSSELYKQYLGMKEEIDSAIQEVIHSAQFVKSGKVLDFEKKLAEYLHTQVIGCGNGTDALQIAFMALGLQPGDEVITSPFTFVATVETAVLMGLKPVFVDVLPTTFTLDAAKVEAAISANTKAVLPVHLFGQCANMEQLLAIATKHNLYLIEDACQALGTDYFFSDGSIQKAGTMGHIGCNSFFPSKNLGAFGDAGAIFTKDTELAKVIRSIANHGMKAKYEYERVGVNSRLDSIQAAILEVKLRYLDRDIEKRKQVASFYDHHLKDIKEIQLPERAAYSAHTFHQYTLTTRKRDELKSFLGKRGIPSMVYYPNPIHLQEAYRFLEYRKGDFPISEKLAETVLSIPIHSEMDQEQMEFIVAAIKEFYRFN